MAPLSSVDIRWEPRGDATVPSAGEFRLAAGRSVGDRPGEAGIGGTLLAASAASMGEPCQVMRG